MGKGEWCSACLGSAELVDPDGLHHLRRVGGEAAEAVVVAGGGRRRKGRELERRGGEEKTTWNGAARVEQGVIAHVWLPPLM